MAAIDVKEAMKYGFVLTAYVVGVGLIGGLFLMIGGVLAQSDSIAMMLVGAVVAIVGVFTVYGALFGAMYKLIGDANREALKAVA